MHIALYQPEIPPNTGNIIRLCANTGAQLHLIHPLGFNMEEKALRRAGLDYHEWAQIQQYQNYEIFLQQHQGKRVFACTTKAQQHYTQPNYESDDILLFGPETRGLPLSVRESLPGNQLIRIPMKADSRSLNLSNAVAVILYESMRQLNWPELS